MREQSEKKKADAKIAKLEKAYKKSQDKTSKNATQVRFSNY